MTPKSYVFDFVHLAPFRTPGLVGIALRILLTTHRAVMSMPAVSTRTATLLLVDGGTVVADDSTRAPRTIVSTSRTLVVAEFLRAPSGTARTLGTRRALHVRLIAHVNVCGRVVAHQELGRTCETGFVERVAGLVGTADVCGDGPDHLHVMTTRLPFTTRRLVREIAFLPVPPLDGVRQVQGTLLSGDEHILTDVLVLEILFRVFPEAALRPIGSQLGQRVIP